MRARRGFTMAELLVVIGIVLVLLAILLPAIQMARESARSAKCASNVRQIVHGMLMYAMDNQGVMPSCSDKGTVWRPGIAGWISYFYPSGSPNTTDIEFVHGAFMKYLGPLSMRPRIMRCMNAQDGTANYNYVLPSQLDETHPVRLAAITHPSSKIILVEMNGVGDGFDGHFNIDEVRAEDGDQPADHHLHVGQSSTPSDTQGGKKPPDIGYGNHGFADGHVESRGRFDLDFHPELFRLTAP